MTPAALAMPELSRKRLARESLFLVIARYPPFLIAPSALDRMRDEGSAIRPIHHGGYTMENGDASTIGS